MDYDYLLDAPDYADQEEMMEAWADREFMEAMQDFDIEDMFDEDELAANASSDWENERYDF